MADIRTVKRLENFIRSEQFANLAPEKQGQYQELITRLQQESALPGADRTRAIQEQRVPASERLQEELATPYSGNIGQKAIKAGVTGIKGLAVPFERAESGLAAPLEKLQLAATPEAGFVSTPEMELRKQEGLMPTSEQLAGQREKRFGLLGEAGESALAGLKGEKVTEFGDIPRRAGWSEPVSAAIGFGTAVAAIDPLIGKAFTGSIKKLTDFFKGTVPIKAATDVTLNLTKKLHGGLLGVRDTLSKNVTKTMTALKGKQVDLVEWGKILKSLPDDVIKKAQKNYYKVKRLADGTVDPDATNVWRFRQFLDDLMSTKDYTDKIGRSQKIAIKSARRDTAKLLAGTDESVAPVMESYSSFSDKFDPILDTITDKYGNVVEKGLRGVFKTGAERAKQKFFIDMQEFYPDVLNTVQEIVRFNRRQMVGKGVKGAVKTAATIGLLRGAFKGIGRGGETGGSNAGEGSTR